MADAMIFDSLSSPGEVRARQGKELQDKLTGSFGIEDPAARAGTQIGLGLSSIARLAGLKSPEERHAQQLQDVFDKVDKEWQDDPEALPAENAAGRINALRMATGNLLNPAQRLELIGKETALRSDAFNQSRLQASDVRDEGKYKQDMEAAQLALRGAQVDYDTKLRVAHEGLEGNQWVFQYPDGSTKMAGQGGDDFKSMMDLMKDQPELGIKVLGTQQDLLKHQQAMELQDRRDANDAAKLAAKKKGVKFTDKRLGEYSDLDSVGNILGFLNSEEAKEGLARFGGAAGLLDRTEEWVASVPFLSNVANAIFGVDGDTPSSKVKVYIDRLRGVQQSLIKGVPSNNDQYIYDLSNPQTYVAPAVNEIRLKLITDDAEARMRAAYAKAKEEIALAGMTGEQEVPRSLVHALAQMGIDPSDIGTAEDEMVRLNEVTARGTETWNTVKKSGGARANTEHADYLDPMTGEKPKKKAGASGDYKAPTSGELTTDNGSVVRF